MCCTSLNLPPAADHLCGKLCLLPVRHTADRGRWLSSGAKTLSVTQGKTCSDKLRVFTWMRLLWRLARVDGFMRDENRGEELDLHQQEKCQAEVMENK